MFRPDRREARTHRWIPHGTKLLPRHLTGLALDHARRLIRRDQTVRLHLALDRVKRIASEPEHFARQASIQRQPPGLDLASAAQAPSLDIGVHQKLIRQEPHPVRLRLAQHRHRLPSIQPVRDTRLAH